MGVPSVWSHRIAALLRESPNASLLLSSRSSGIEHAVRRLDDPRLPLVWYWATSKFDGPVQTARLATAVRRGLGTQLLAPGVDALRGIEALGEELPRIGPIRVVVGWLDNCRNVASAFLESIKPPSHLIVIGSDAPLEEDIIKSFHLLDASDLSMRESEAIEAARGVLSPAEAISLMAEVKGEYGAFLERLIEFAGGSESGTYSRSYKTARGRVRIDPIRLFGLLMARSRWVEALEHACEHCPNLVPEVIEMGGHQLANLGAFDYLGALLQRLPVKVRRHPKTAYWMLASAIATNRVKEARSFANLALHAAEAPEVRATLAVLSPNVGMVSDTAEAVQLSDSPITLRAHAFAIAYEGERESSVHLFRSAMRMAEQQGADHLVIACALDIANLETALGRYSSGAEWARWALFEYHRRGLSEELRRQSAITGVVFPSILLGELEGVESLVDSVGPYLSRLGVPTYESVVSTLGDWDFINGRLDSAAVHYERVYEAATVDQTASASLDLIRCLIALGMGPRAMAIATQVHAVAQSSSRQERAFAELGMAMAIHRIRPQKSIELLISSIEGLKATCYVVLQAQASIWLAILRLQAGDLNGVRDALKVGNEGLIELGASGWKLLSGLHPAHQRVKTIWESGRSEMTLALLGNRRLQQDGAVLDLPLRFAEITALLAAHPEGLKCQRLQSLLFGDGGTEANVKAALSKLRKLVPITPSPYRLPEHTHVDFLDLMGSINAGEIQRALSLYHGPLLPESEAPGVVELRALIDEGLRQAVVESGDPELLIQLATVIDDDLGLWETARARLVAGDHRRPLISARIRRIRATW